MKVATLSVTMLILGCGSQSHRFVPVGEGTFALDTKTGQQCLSVPRQEVDKDAGAYPLCVDLYKSQ